nr:hypothetical protein [uncultured Rhodopila sp.]
MIWMKRNQLDRRNLSPFARIEIVADIEALEAEKAKERQREAGAKHSGNQHTREKEVEGPSTLTEVPSEPEPSLPEPAAPPKRDRTAETRTRAAKAAGQIGDAGSIMESGARLCAVASQPAAASCCPP